MLSLQGNGVTLTGTINGDGTVSASGTGPASALGVVAGLAANAVLTPSNWKGNYTSFHEKASGGGFVEVSQNSAMMNISLTPSGPNQFPFTVQVVDASNPIIQYLYGHGTVTLNPLDTPSTIARDATLRGALDSQAINIQATIGGTPIYATEYWDGSFSGTGPDGGATHGTFKLNRFGL